MRLLLALVAFAMLAPAHAIPVEWELNNIQFVNATWGYSPVSGSFIYDADTNLVSGVGLQVDNLPGGSSSQVFTNGFDLFSDGSALLFTDSPVASAADLLGFSGAVMRFNFTSPLTNSAGSTGLVEGVTPPVFTVTETELGFCSDADVGVDDCAVLAVYQTGTFADGPYSGGNLTGSVVPIPAAVWLFGSALLGLGWMRRRH